MKLTPRPKVDVQTLKLTGAKVGLSADSFHGRAGCPPLLGEIQTSRTTPGQKMDFYTHSFAKDGLSWYKFFLKNIIAAAKSSNS